MGDKLHHADMFNNIEQMMEMMRMISVMSGRDKGWASQPETAQQQKFMRTYAFETGASPALEAVKDAISHLEEPYCRMMQTVVKLIEIQKLLHDYRRIIDDIGKGGNLQRHMLAMALPQLPSEKREQVEWLVRLLEMKKMMFENDA